MWFQGALHACTTTSQSSVRLMPESRPVDLEYWRASHPTVHFPFRVWETCRRHAIVTCKCYTCQASRVRLVPSTSSRASDGDVRRLMHRTAYHTCSFTNITNICILTVPTLNHDSQKVPEVRRQWSLSSHMPKYAPFSLCNFCQILSPCFWSVRSAQPEGSSYHPVSILLLLAFAPGHDFSYFSVLYFFFSSSSSFTP